MQFQIHLGLHQEVDSVKNMLSYQMWRPLMNEGGAKLSLRNIEAYAA